MALKLHHLAVFALGLAGLALSGAPASAHPQYGYGHGYYPRPNPYPRGHGEVVIIQPPVRYAPPPVYYAPAPYPRYGYYGRPGVSLNFRF